MKNPPYSSLRKIWARHGVQGIASTLQQILLDEVNELENNNADPEWIQAFYDTALDFGRLAMQYEYPTRVGLAYPHRERGK